MQKARVQMHIPLTEGMGMGNQGIIRAIVAGTCWCIIATGLSRPEAIARALTGNEHVCVLTQALAL